MAARKKGDSWPDVSDAELTVLKSLWEQGPGTVREVQSRLLEAGTEDWAYTTVQTLLTRLEEKQYVAVARSATAHVFRAAVTRDDLAGKRIDEVADGLLGGVTAPLLLRLVEKGRFTPQEIARFRAMLDAAERRTRKDGDA